MSEYKGHSIIDNLELAKRAEERRTDYAICQRCDSVGIWGGEICDLCHGNGYVVTKQGKA